MIDIPHTHTQTMYLMHQVGFLNAGDHKPEDLT